MRKMGKHIPGLIVTLVVLITAIVFAVMLLNMKGDPDEVHCSDRTGNAGPDRDRRGACMEYGW